MFYAYLVIGFLTFGAGLLLIPGWFKLAWVALFFLGMMILPWLLEQILDPLNSKRIRAYCSNLSVEDIKIRPFPNHYGVHFIKNGKKRYYRCKVVRGTIQWVGKSPEELT